MHSLCDVPFASCIRWSCLDTFRFACLLNELRRPDSHYEESMGKPSSMPLTAGRNKRDSDELSNYSFEDASGSSLWCCFPQRKR